MKNVKTPLRKCTGCQEMKDKKEMFRILRTPEGEILLDAGGKKNGRGAYVCPKVSCLQKAMKSRALERSLKVAVPEAVYEELKKEMERLEDE